MLDLLVIDAVSEVKFLLRKGHSMVTLKKQRMAGIRSKDGKSRRTVSGSSIKVHLTHKLSQTASFRRAVERSVATTRKNGNPVAKYDVQRRQAYLEYPDGKRAYVE